MPKKLSLQNAKKQVVEYMIYIITMVITVALLLSFNMIIFSEEIAAIINEKSILPLILITVSVLVVLVISALVKHITVFMVRKRSREFGLYMLLGVENNDIELQTPIEYVVGYICKNLSLTDMPVKDILQELYSNKITEDEEPEL